MSQFPWPILWEGRQNHRKVLCNSYEGAVKGITLDFLFLWWPFISWHTCFHAIVWKFPLCVMWFDLTTCQMLALESKLKSPLGWEPSASQYPTPKVSVSRKWIARKKTTFKNWHACSHLWKKKRNLSKHSHLPKAFSCLKEVFVFQSATSNTTFWLRVTHASILDMIDDYVKWHWPFINGRSVNQ